MTPILELISQSMNYGNLPETWRVPEIEKFSSQKTLYDYQRSALENAARALFLYYGQDHDWISGETQSANSERKRDFAGLYGNHDIAGLRRYERPVDEKNKNENQVFRILSDFIPPQGDLIPYHNLINRMCFWMATGSGKTLVMVKLIEYLYRLQQHGEIPTHNILILAPSDHLIGQIDRTIEEFNRSGGLQIDLIPLRQAGRAPYQRRLGDSVTVYYHRSDNISDVQKEALTDYRTYENGGKWYVFLDEAHKGGNENSKRQAYYAVMAREGFLFNFSATFTDKEDIVTTVKKYNLEEFVTNGHGKNIYLNETQFNAFQTRRQEISGAEKRKIVLKSLITLAYVSMCVKALREETGIETLYHRPLMMTLVNSVNTDINEQNDLWAFFQTLLGIASGEIDNALFTEIKNELLHDWSNAELLFKGNGSAIVGVHENAINAIKKMKITDVREAIFLARRKGALQFICGKDKKELAFQMRNADSPFALIRIGDTSKWRKLLDGYEETTTLQEKSFFDGLEKSSITILMGSRSFFESWDSNRPNVINFINIGGKDAKKFVVQSIGRGVRIEPLKNKRRRLARLLSELKGKEKIALENCHDLIAPPETLFLFATNRAAVKTVLEGVKTEKGSGFETLEVFEKAPIPKIGNKKMPLLVPVYKEVKGAATQEKFTMSKETFCRLKSWLAKTSDSVLVVRDGLALPDIVALRGMVKQKDAIKTNSENHYAMIPFLQNRLVSHISQSVEISDGVREIDNADIVHFREIRVHPEYACELQEKIEKVKQGRSSNQEISESAKRLASGEITREEFDKLASGTGDATFKDLKIKKIIGHYYLPVVVAPGDERASYIQHIIKTKSEVKFLNELEKWTGENSMKWDAWMFSKLDESLDQIYIPYYDGLKNEYRHFMPDFIFWMCKGNDYRIVFVDPKGGAHTNAYHKIDGYRKLFEQSWGKGLAQKFPHGKNRKVSVELLMFNPKTSPPQAYRPYWTRDPGAIFKAA